MLAVPGIDTLRAGDPRFTQECTPQEKTEAIVTGTQDLSSIYRCKYPFLFGNMSRVNQFR